MLHKTISVPDDVVPIIDSLDVPLISRGQPVDLDRPWPTRSPIPGEKVANWAARTLTIDLVGG
jgi:hypothetical protein